jgi:hypothetical protein
LSSIPGRGRTKMQVGSLVFGRYTVLILVGTLIILTEVFRGFLTSSMPFQLSSTSFPNNYSLQWNNSGACDSILVKALCYKQEGHVFETERWGFFFLIYLILPAALGPGVYSASNRNEYQKQKNNVSGE